MTRKQQAEPGPLLRYLARTALIPNDVAQRAEAELASQESSMTAIDWLVRRAGVGEDAVAESLARSLRWPLVDLAIVALDPAVTRLIREDFATHHLVVPLRVEQQNLVVAMTDPLDRSVLRDIESATGKRVQVEIATQTAVRDALRRAYHLDDALNDYLRGVPECSDIQVAEQRDEPTTGLSDLMRESAHAPVVKLLNLILAEGLRGRASNIHIEAESRGVRVRYLIDGILEKALRLPKWIQDPLVSRCKVLARLDITERRVPQDGRIQVRFREVAVDLRVSCLPTQHGEKVTMCILEQNGPNCGTPANPTAALAAVPSPMAAPPGGAAPPAAAGPRCYRALVVDDNEDMRRLVTFMLEHSELPLTTVSAASGAEALEVARSDPPDLILLDIMLPGMDGFRVCEQLRTNVRTAFIPILMVTGCDDAGSRARAFLAGTDDYVSKPFPRAELLARVRRLLERTYGTVPPKPPAATAPVPGTTGEGQRAALH